MQLTKKKINFCVKNKNKKTKFYFLNSLETRKSRDGHH